MPDGSVCFQPNLCPDCAVITATLTKSARLVSFTLEQVGSGPVAGTSDPVGTFASTFTFTPACADTLCLAFGEDFVATLVVAPGNGCFPGTPQLTFTFDFSTCGTVG